MQTQKGQLSIHAQNLLPIIKKWLYSDRDIFLRELVANGCDAISKFKALQSDCADELRVQILADPEAKTLSFIDNGIGMTSDEIDRYINQVAFSGAQEFIEKLQSTGASAENIIGHFGLGFYSAFMVSDRVTIDTLSWQEGAQSAFWESQGGLEYEMRPGTRTQRGTVITLYLNEDSAEYLSEEKIRSIAAQYLNFMPVPIYIGQEEAPINDPTPLYLRRPSEVTEEEYKEFYKKTFGAWEDPLFWVHLNIDFPFSLRGILYFPKIQQDYRLSDGCVKLYSRQVFVAENIKEIIPEYLLLLKGVIDSPDIPLNVSRSFLQSDSQVKQLSAHISRKAADRLTALFESERERYESVWADISLFVKYGCLRDEKFYDRVKGALLFQNVEGAFLTLEEVRAQSEANEGIFYIGMENKDAPIVALYRAAKVPMLCLDTPIDLNFIPFLEYKNEKLRFKRIDSEVAGAMVQGEAQEQQRQELETLMRSALGKEDLTVKLQSFQDEETPAMLLFDEQMRRFKDSDAFFGRGLGLPVPATLVLNEKSPVVAMLLSRQDEEQLETARQIYDLAELAQGSMSRERLADFIRRSYRFL